MSVCDYQLCVQSTFVNQQRWDVRCCVCDGFQAPAEVQKRVSVFLWELLSLKCALSGKERQRNERVWNIYLGLLTDYHQSGYNHHGNCPLWTKGELGRGGEESRHKRHSQSCWGCWANFCYSPCLLKGCLRKNMWKKKNNRHKNIIFPFVSWFGRVPY